MTDVTIIETETTTAGDMVELILDKHIKPVVGMVLIDEESRTWEVTATLHDAQRYTGDSSTIRWTFQCKPLNTDDSIHTGPFKLMH
jgi:hypothetical protein